MVLNGLELGNGTGVWKAALYGCIYHFVESQTRWVKTCELEYFPNSGDPFSLYPTGSTPLRLISEPTITYQSVPFPLIQAL
jgi:hypothetical protein